jgi:3-carboxy-cis,cis-muconate cycloisomerase
MTVDTERMRRNLELTGGLIMAEAIATALAAPLGRAAAEAVVARACNRAVAESVPLATVLRIDPELRPHLTDADIDRLTNPALYLGSAGTFVDRIVARVAALG